MNDFEILSGDVVTAIWKDRQLTVLNRNLLPMYLVHFSDAQEWLKTRAIDSHRANSRLIKKALRLTQRDDLSTVLCANGVTVTDNYWVRAIGDTTKYADVCFNADYFNNAIAKSFAKLALTGKQSSFNVVAQRATTHTPELTNVGSFEKCWKNINNEWWLYKVADKNEAFSEVFIYHLCCLLGISCAQYQKDGNFVRTLDFTQNQYNFEPAFSFMGEEEDYELTVKKLAVVCPQAIPDYVKMIFLDTLVFNPDRHTANFGLLKNRTTGVLEGLAPCFDHNMALISRGYPTGKSKSDLLISLFCEFMHNHPEYKSFLPTVNEELLDLALAKTNAKVKSDAVKSFILFRYALIK